MSPSPEHKPIFESTSQSLPRKVARKWRSPSWSLLLPPWHSRWVKLPCCCVPDKNYLYRLWAIPKKNSCVLGGRKTRVEVAPTVFPYAACLAACFPFKSLKTGRNSSWESFYPLREWKLALVSSSMWTMGLRSIWSDAFLFQRDWQMIRC